MQAKFLGRSFKLLVISLLITSCATPVSNISSDSESGFVSGDGTSIFLNQNERKPAPELSNVEFLSSEIDLKTLKNKVVLINVWGSWCSPCRKEAPELEELYLKNKADNVEFIGINIRDSKISATRFIENFSITYPNIFDRDGKLLLGYKDSLPANAIPSTILIDKNGLVAARQLGPIDKSLIQGFITELVEE
ncbi:MAG: TlpA family protein disulfide reductase [Candidatus Nanopelagicales bacterium]